VTWYSTTGTTAAAAVAEGGTKPTSTIAYTANTGTVTKLAHVVEVTDETLQDFPAFMSVLQQDMAAGLYKAENDELLNAAVGTAHKFAGLLNTTGILTLARTTETDPDIIAAGFDSLRVGSSFANPDGIVMHPTTWGIIRRMKDSTGQYLLAGTKLPQVDPQTAARWIAAGLVVEIASKPKGRAAR
jgi:HK97 family phage major capsid protein